MSMQNYQCVQILSLQNEIKMMNRQEKAKHNKVDLLQSVFWGRRNQKMQKEQQQFKLISKTKAQINVDCIKVCPFDNNLFAFAYYQQAQTFLGGISLQYQHQNQHEELITKFDILQCGPVLHICWLNKKIDNKMIFIGASRSQKIFIFSVAFSEQNKPTITLEKEIHIQNNVFCLYVDCWMRNQQDFEVIVSTNESQVFQLKINLGFQLIETKTFSKHQYAVWTCRLNPFSQKMQFVCGDQVNSIYWYNHEGTLIGKNSRAHDQGICDLVFVNEHKMYSGGFDGYINEFDMRNFQKPIRTFKLGGTIWRVIPDKSLQNLLICNSSQKKFQIIDSDSGKQRWTSKSQHGSLAYSADWNEQVLLTSSFYDQVVCLWKK